MTVIETAVNRMTPRNLRVSRAAFASVWTIADRMRFAANTELNWYSAGVIVTCEWLAGSHHDRYRREGIVTARSPVGDRMTRATEDSIEAEYQAAELMAMRRPWLLEQRPGWCEGIRATLRWAWRNEGPPPLDGNGEPTAWSAPRT